MNLVLRFIFARPLHERKPLQLPRIDIIESRNKGVLRDVLQQLNPALAQRLLPPRLESAVELDQVKAVLCSGRSLALQRTGGRGQNQFIPKPDRLFLCNQRGGKENTDKAQQRRNTAEFHSQNLSHEAAENKGREAKIRNGVTAIEGWLRTFMKQSSPLIAFSLTPRISALFFRLYLALKAGEFGGVS